MLKQEHFDNRPKVRGSRLNILPNNPEQADPEKAVGPGRFPSWLHRKLPSGTNLKRTGEILDNNQLHTVCEEAKCPNLLECWSKKTATFLAMGKDCTRNCGFCDIDFSKAPAALDPEEPQRIADSSLKLGLKHIVITMVARDDLPDGGAAHLNAIIQAVRNTIHDATVELLISDLQGNLSSLDLVLQARPEIFNHNIETVRSLTPRVRHKATYDRTLQVLTYAATNKHNPDMLVKSGMMVGLGETDQEVHQTIQDLKSAGCSVITIGQYLQPNTRKLLVKSFVTPEKFKQYEEFGYSIGVKHMYCGPFVRSSYNADLFIRKEGTSHGL